MNKIVKKKSKVTRRNEESKKILSNRLARLEGQLRGVNKMIQDDQYCDDILIQLSAIDKAIKSIANLILDEHLKTCVVSNIQKGNLEVMDEISTLFKKFQ
ncbi:MAG: metal-sensing transcriptional repressor [Anaerovoracaceae bacterium]